MYTQSYTMYNVIKTYKVETVVNNANRQINKKNEIKKERSVN